MFIDVGVGNVGIVTPGVDETGTAPGLNIATPDPVGAIMGIRREAPVVAGALGDSCFAGASGDCCFGCDTGAGVGIGD